MSPFARPQLRFLAIWLLASPAALLASPWGPFGWAELVAALGPLVLGVDRRIRPPLALFVGLGAIASLCLLDARHPALPRLLVDAVVFAIGLGLVSRTLARLPELESVAGRSFEDFKAALERELARARRHGKGLVVLSIALDPGRGASDRASSPPAAPSGRSAAHRALALIGSLLARELRLYSDVVVDRGRALALVPEVDEEAFDRLVERVRAVLEKGLDFEVQIGIGWFPRDAVAVDGLISAADESRARSSLRAQSAPDLPSALEASRVSRREVSP